MEVRKQVAMSEENREHGVYKDLVGGATRVAMAPKTKYSEPGSKTKAETLR